MHDPHEQHLGIVIRRDGTVPFDDDVHPIHRQAIIENIVAAGFLVVQDALGGFKIADWVPPPSVSE